ncbi:MAG: glycosyltransferase [Sulfuritalea sp.]|nr:glycosyltransferase [Sulfuritalea sp.]
MTIPRRFHVVWVGDESRRPDDLIQTWRDKHPGAEVKVWGNRELEETPWINAHHMRDFANRELNGVADLMRWEILWREGGVTLDADSVCVQALPDWLFDCEMFAAWENEIARPGLIAMCTLGASAGNPFIARIVEDIRATPSFHGRMAWEVLGPGRLTEAHRKYRYHNLTLLPSHFFLPRHYTGGTYSGNGPVYAEQYWDNTGKLLGANFRPPAPAVGIR